jgi:hypothetical protein
MTPPDSGRGRDGSSSTGGRQRSAGWSVANSLSMPPSARMRARVARSASRCAAHRRPVRRDAQLVADGEQRRQPVQPARPGPGPAGQQPAGRRASRRLRVGNRTGTRATDLDRRGPAPTPGIEGRPRRSAASPCSTVAAGPTSANTSAAVQPGGSSRAMEAAGGRRERTRRRHSASGPASREERSARSASSVSGSGPRVPRRRTLARSLAENCRRSIAPPLLSTVDDAEVLLDKGFTRGRKRMHHE